MARYDASSPALIIAASHGGRSIRATGAWGYCACECFAPTARRIAQIVLPLSRGAVATLAIFTFLNFWNDFTWPYLVINVADKMTLPVALIQFKGDYFSNYGQLIAGAAVSALPAIVVFLMAQRMIIRSISLTGIKG